MAGVVWGLHWDTIRAICNAVKAKFVRADYPPAASLPGTRVVLRDDVKEYPLPRPLKAGRAVTIVEWDIGTYKVRTDDGHEQQVFQANVDV
jgi:hypothetical protein